MIEREYALKSMTGARGISEQIVRTGYPGLRGVDFTRPMKHGMATLLKQRMMAGTTMRVRAEVKLLGSWSQKKGLKIAARNSTV